VTESVLAAASLHGSPGIAGGDPGWLRIRDGRLVEVGTGRPPPEARDLGDAVLAPGFVDLQVNGVGDVDFAAASPDAAAAALARLAGHGVTSCCPTLVTAPLDGYDAPLRRLAAVMRAPEDPIRSAIAGVHLEGPFLGGAPGAHPVELVRTADPVWSRDLLDRFPGLVRIMTLAPEADPGLAVTRLLAGRGVTVALGHTTATCAEAVAAADAGARLVTHLFNGMGPFHHREPGVVGAALTDHRLVPSVIADLVHLHPVALEVVFAAKAEVALVSDAVAAGAGAVGPVAIREDGGVARLADGTLAGSLLTLDAAVRNVVRLGVPLGRALAAASAVPAAAIGLHDRGRLEAGRRADLVALDPEALTVQAVWVGGAEVSRLEP